ncbi:hypothetical protein AAG906_029666 [Vitis piasezkii]
MKLNPSKCAFGVSLGKFLGFMVTQRGIEVNLDQIKVVIETSAQSNKKELQRPPADSPFFLMLKGADTIEWTEDYQSEFEEIKQYLTQPPILSCPQPDEQLYMYLVVFNWAVNAVLLSIKGQVMADFIAEIPQQPPQFIEPGKEGWWTLHVDGASRTSGSGVGLLLQSPTRELLEKAIRLGFPASNNEAEYEAILSELNLALALLASKLEICSDSQLVLNKWAIKRIIHTENVQVNALAGSTSSIVVTPVYNAREEGIKWTREIENYLRIGDLPEESKHAHKVRMQAAHFTLIGDRLFRQSFGGPYLRCLDNTEAQYVLAELHEGICGNHIGGRSLAHRAHS